MYTIKFLVICSYDQGTLWSFNSISLLNLWWGEVAGALLWLAHVLFEAYLSANHSGSVSRKLLAGTKLSLQKCAFRMDVRVYKWFICDILGITEPLIIDLMLYYLSMSYQTKIAMIISLANYYDRVPVISLLFVWLVFRQI